MSGVEAYYWAHAREFTYGRVSPLGLYAGSVGFAAIGLAMMFQQAGGVYDALMASGFLGALLFWVDFGVAAIVGPRPARGVPAGRGPGQTRTFTSDRQVVVATLFAAVGSGVAVCGMTTIGLLAGSPVVVAAVTVVAAGWAGVLVAKSRGLTVTIDDRGIRDDTFPFRHRVATWDRIESASVFSLPPASQVILELRSAPGKAGSPQSWVNGRRKRLRIPCSYLTVSAGELLQIITADPMFRSGHVQRADSGS